MYADFHRITGAVDPLFERVLVMVPIQVGALRASDLDWTSPDTTAVPAAPERTRDIDYPLPASDEHDEHHEQPALADLLREAGGNVARASRHSANHKHITSIKGIADAAGIQILAEIAVLPKDMSVREWVAHAGLDPRQFQSGTSVNKPARIVSAR